MNKLYCIKCYMKEHRYLLAVFNFWNPEEALNKMTSDLSGWEFEIVENNDTHIIWEGSAI